jgi:exopolysaccharide production protein ExoQ
MNTAVHLAFPCAAGARPQTQARAGVSFRFPVRFLFLAWLILFPYQHQLDPRQTDASELDSVAGTARTGNATHQVLAILLGALGIYAIRKWGGNLRVRGPVGTLLAGYVAWVALSAFWSDDLDVTLRRQIAFVLILIFCAGCAALMNKDGLSLFIAGLVALNLGVAVIQELIMGTLNPFIPGNRFSGTVSPNTQGAALAMASIVVLWFAWRTSGSHRLKALCAAAVFLLFLLMTGSRTSLLGLFGALTASLVLLIFSRYRKQPMLLVTGLLVLLALGTGAALVSVSGVRPPELSGITNVLRAERDVGEVTDFTGRNLIWNMCLRYAAERPTLGFGYGAFWTSNRIATVADELKWVVPHSHSAYLDVLLQTGVPGVSLYILLLIVAIGTCVRQFLNGDAACGAWVAILVFVAVNGLTESIVILPTFPAVAVNILMMKLALRRIE